ncbi:MAG: AAA family ATPase [Actinomycetota bacterium]
MSTELPELVLTAADFVGRESHIRELSRAIDEATAGKTTLLLISGEPGIGKTRLVEEARSHATSLGAEIHWGRCWTEEGAPAYWPWVQVIRSLAQSRDNEAMKDLLGVGAGEVAQIVPELGDGHRFSESPAVALPEQARFRLFDAVGGLLKRSAAAAPLVIILDDLHAADHSTLLLLRFLAHELVGSRLLLVGTFRDVEVEEGNPLNTILEESLPNRRTLSLGGLEQSEVAALVEQTAGSVPSEEFAQVLHEKSGGNPLFVKELVALLQAQGKLDAVTALANIALPRGLTEVIERRLSRLSSPCYQLLSAASVLGQEFDFEMAATLGQIGRSEAIELLDEAERARLVFSLGTTARQWKFDHALVRASLYDSLGTAARVELHKIAAETLQTLHEADPEAHLSEIAHHFVRAVALSGPEPAVDFSVRAGRLACRRFAYEEGVQHFRAAVEVAGSRRGDLLLLLGDALIRSGAFEEAKKVYDEVADQARAGGNAELLARAALGLGAGLGGFEITMRDQRQIDLLEDALKALGEEDSVLRARVMARLSIALAFVASQQRRVELSLRAAEIADRVGDPAAKAYALSTFCDARSGPEFVAERLDAADEMIRLARSVGDKEMELLGRRYRVVALAEKGDRPALDKEIDAYARLATFLRQPLSSWYVPLFRATVALMEGRLEDCERLAAQASEMGRWAQSRNVYELVDLSLLPALWVEQGRTEDLETKFFPALREMRDMTGIDWPAIFAAVIGLESDTSASAALERLTADDAVTLERDGMFLPLMNYIVLGCVQSKEARAAEVLYRELAPFENQFSVCGICGACYGVVAHNLGLLAAVLERWDVAEKHFENALKAHGSSGAHLLLTHTRDEYARMLLARNKAGDRGKAMDLLKSAMATYRRLGMTSWQERAEALLEVQPTGTNSFARTGDVWTLEFDNRTGTLKDSKGLRDLAALIARPNQEIHVSELATVRSAEAGSREPGLTGGEGADAVLDATAKEQYRARLAELNEELEEAQANNDTGRATKLGEEIDFLTAELARAYGLGGRSRKLGDPAERARKAVTGRIKDAIGRISKVHPILGRHLEHSIKTGTFCSYAPENPISWSL